MASFMSKHASKLAVGGLGLVGCYVYASAKPPKPVGHTEVNPLRTPGVQNVEAAYQRGGATSTHTKAYGGTTLGSKDDVPKEGAGTARPKGFDDEPRGMGDVQRAEGSRKGKVAEKWDEMKYGTKSDK